MPLREFIDFRRNQFLHGSAISDSPHFDSEALAYFDRALADAKTYLEYGSGGSTLRAAKLSCRIVTVENDGIYLRAVKKRVGSRPHFTPIHTYIGPSAGWGIPVFDAKHGALKKRLWSRYPLRPGNTSTPPTLR